MPSSVRMKSSAPSEKTTLPTLVFTSTGTSTRLERTEMAGCGPGGDCSPVCAAANKAQNSEATRETSFSRYIMRLFPGLGSCGQENCTFKECYGREILPVCLRFCRPVGVILGRQVAGRAPIGIILGKY